MASAAERRLVLDELSRLAMADLVSLWRQVSVLPAPEFRAVMLDGLSEILAPYSFGAGEMAAQWYTDSAPELKYRGVNFAELDVGAVRGSTEWALAAKGDAALDRLGGMVVRHVFGGARQTTARNVVNEGRGAGWIRTANGNACKFCQMLVTRSETFYSSEKAATQVGFGGGGRVRGSQAHGDDYHDNCKCGSMEVRPGKSHTRPSYTEPWFGEYEAAQKLAGDLDFRAGETATQRLMRAYRLL